MQLSAQVRYEADLDRVVALLADEEYVAAKVRATGALSHQVDVVGTPSDDFTVTTRRQMPTDAIPAQFRSFIGSTLEVRQIEAWEPPAQGPDGVRTRRGTLVVEITGAPVRLTGTMSLTQDGDTPVTVQRYDGDLRASVPLFAAAVEKATAEAVHAAIDAEQRTATEWLARG